MDPVKVTVPYAHNKMEFEVPEKQFIGTIYPKKVKPLSDSKAAIREAIRHPHGSTPLNQNLSGGERIVIIACDITRNARDDITLPVLIEELNKIGVVDDQITIVVATGTHRPDTEDELISLYGEEIIKRINVVNHNAYNGASLSYLGSSRTRGIPVWINKTVVEADYRIATGVIEPHPFAGYSGGRKTMTIGTAGEETIRATHNVEVISHPQTRFGSVEDNIFREFLKESTEFVDVDYIVNVVLNQKKEVLKVVAGDPDKAHLVGVNYARKVYEVSVKERADIVISAPGMPKELNLYQATRAAYSPLLNPKPTLKDGGVVIIPASCQDGIGHPGWYEWMEGVNNPDEIIRKAKKESIRPGEHKAFFLGMLMSQSFPFSRKTKIIVVGAEIEDEIVEKLCLIPANTPSEALKKANQLTNGGKVLVLPCGMVTIPCYEGNH